MEKKVVKNKKESPEKKQSTEASGQVKPPAFPVQPPPIPVKPPPLQVNTSQNPIKYAWVKGGLKFYVRTTYFRTLDIRGEIWFRCNDDFETGFATLNSDGDWEEMSPEMIKKLGSDMMPTSFALMGAVPGKPWESGYGYKIIWKSREEVIEEIKKRKTKKV